MRSPILSRPHNEREPDQPGPLRGARPSLERFCARGRLVQLEYAKRYADVKTAVSTDVIIRAEASRLARPE
jgi:hypothetical protein